MPLSPMIILPFNDYGFVPCRFPCVNVTDATIEIYYSGTLIASSKDWKLVGPAESPTLQFKVLIQNTLVPLQQPDIEKIMFLGPAVPAHPTILTVDPRNPYLWQSWRVEKPRFVQHSFLIPFRPDKLNGLIFSAPVMGTVCTEYVTDLETQHVCIELDMPMRVFLVGVWGKVNSVSFALKYSGLEPVYVWLARWTTGWSDAQLKATITCGSTTVSLTENVRLILLSENWYDWVAGLVDEVLFVGETVL